ncbi:MAG TPA: hypothetical protein EYQ50_18360 [Verrucomicrobiales bacterium]|nr:hypothetical protein [Verrucomicrobiales bacterium]
MQSNTRFIGTVIAVALLYLSPLSAGAAVTGQWDFTDGDLSATLGQEMEYLDGFGGETFLGTEFGTAESFGIPGISAEVLPLEITGVAVDLNGSSLTVTWSGGAPPYILQTKSSLSDPDWNDAGTTDSLNLEINLDADMAFVRIQGSAGGAGGETRVMKFPKIPAENFFGGYFVTTGALPSGDEFFVNRYTVIMDIYFPESSSGKKRGLIQSDLSGDAELFVGGNNGIGSRSFNGKVQPDTWHRIAFAVDQSANVISKFVDGVKVGEETLSQGTDGPLAMESFFYLFNDDNGESEMGYLSSFQFRDETETDGFIAALGGPRPEGILIGTPPNPFISESFPSGSTARFPERSEIGPKPEIKIIVEDGEAALVVDSVVLSFGEVANDGSVDLNVVDAQVVKSGTTTTITWIPTDFLTPLSVYQVDLAYNDDGDPPKNLGTRYKFGVRDFIVIPSGIAGPAGSGRNSGFRIRSVQAPEGTLLPQRITRAIQQLNGTLTDPMNSDVLLADEAAKGPHADGSFSVDGVIDFEREAFPNGNFEGDTLFPGIPGTGFHTDQFTTEIVTFLELSAGFHTFGGQVWIERTDVAGGADDDGFTLYAGQNARDIFSTDVHSFVRSKNAPAFSSTTDDNTFGFLIEEDGLYPFRLVYHQKTRGASLEWYSIDESSGEKILINNVGDPRAIRAFQTSSAENHNTPFVAEVNPNAGSHGVVSSKPIEILLIDDEIAVDGGSIHLFLNDGDVTGQSSIEKSGNHTTVVYRPNPTRSDEFNQMRLEFSDASGTSFTREWDFTIKTDTGRRTIATGQWDFNNPDNGLGATIGRDLEFIGGAGGLAETDTIFDTTTSLGIADINGEPANVMVVPDMNSRNIGYIMHHGIAPNGGGTKVNQYTFIMDVMVEAGGAAGFMQIDSLENTNDSDYFWQGSNFGQGGGGYAGQGTFTPDEWHRVTLSVDLAASPPLIVKYVDGIKQDEWVQQSLDQNRRALKEFSILFTDGDQDEQNLWYVNSVQIRDGKLTDAEIVQLGGPSAGGIGESAPSTLTGQWDFNGDLSATIGADLEFIGGAGGLAETDTIFDTTTNLGIADINGEPANVMVVPDMNSRNIGYIMHHRIAPNGGGTKVNQYTFTMDVMVEAGGAAGFMQIDSLENTNDSDYFWQGNNFGQGGGGYNGLGTFTPDEWHRVSLAVDLAADPPLITKFVDGIKQDDWVQQSLDQNRRALKEFAILFTDGDQDEQNKWYVNRVQIREGKLSDAELALLGGPSATDGVIAIPETNVTGQWDFNGGLVATIGTDLEFIGGAGGLAESDTLFDNTANLAIEGINGEPTDVMVVPDMNSRNIGYIMHHGIAPNGGGTKVNQYTFTMDVMVEAGGAAGFMQIDSLENTNDSDFFWQGSNFGQGGGGYRGQGTFTPDEWHRVSLSVDLAADPPLIIKYVDGIKQDDWVQQSLDQNRRALKEFSILFTDGDQDEQNLWYVSAVQIREGALTDAQLALLGGPSASGISIATPQSGVAGQWDFNSGNLGATVGTDLEFIGGAGSLAETETIFDTTTNLGIADINGEPANVMVVPDMNSRDIAYKMFHGIAPNGGGTKVNQYTFIMDVMVEAGGAAGFMQIDSLENTNDSDYFWQGNNFGQGGGG